MYAGLYDHISLAYSYTYLYINDSTGVAGRVYRVEPAHVKNMMMHVRVDVASTVAAKLDSYNTNVASKTNR